MPSLLFARSMSDKGFFLLRAERKKKLAKIILDIRKTELTIKNVITDLARK